MSKQDRHGARTVSDLERRYDFGKRFSEIQVMAEVAQKSVKQLDEKLTSDEIFNRLTNGGTSEGLYKDDDGNICANASSIHGGVLASEDGKVAIDLSGGEVKFDTGISTNGLTVRADEVGAKNLLTIRVVSDQEGFLPYGLLEFFGVNGNRLFWMNEAFNADSGDPTGVILKLSNQDESKKVEIGTGTTNAGIWVKNGDDYAGSLLVDANGKAKLNIDMINGKTVSWKDNGDGTYSLIGI